jgi:hypothetical protein
VDLQSEQGHIGSGIASIAALAGGILLAIGLDSDTTALSVAGAIVLGLGIFVAANAPHIWMRSIYRRLDRVDPDDHDAMPEKRARIQF